MDKDSVLTRMLNSKGLSTLVGGKLPVSVINNSEYISPLTSEAQVTDGDGGRDLPSADHAIHSALRAEIKTVVLVGPEGSGKTTALEKLVVDWAKGEHLQNFSYVFYFPLREIISLEVSLLSLVSLMQNHHSPVPPASIPLLLQRPEDVLFIFDDLHQYKCSLDPSIHTLCSDPFQAVPVLCLMASLLHGLLLKRAALVVATRPTACLEFLSGTTVEVLGFLKSQRQAYFSGCITDPAAADQALMHMNRTLGFYDFCTFPRFCWTVCSVYKCLIAAGKELPTTLSQLYVDILVHLIQSLSLNKSSIKELLLALGTMASHCCLDRHSSCTKKEIDSFGLQPFLSSVGVFLKVVGDIEQDACVFSFHSQLLLEFILALSFFLDESMSEGVEKMLERHKGHTEFLDLFLSGLSEPVQRRPLETLLGEFNSDEITSFKCWFKSSSEETLKGWNKEMHYHCFRVLYQAQNKSLVKEIIALSSLQGITYGGLSFQDCVALNYIVMCLSEWKELNLYHTRNLTEEQAEVLIPTMSLSHKITLSYSSLNTGAVPHLASALSRGIATELDLAHTQLGDEKLHILCAGLRDCKLFTLNLLACNLTCCEDLVSVLTSGTSRLRVLKMMFNHIGDQGFVQLCKSLHSPLCKLQELWLQRCEITAASMEAFAAALCSGQSELRKVDLTQNIVGDNGVKALCKSLQHPLCKLRSLLLYDNELTGACCPHLMEALMSEHCSLSELDLSVNDLGQEGALLLCQALSRPGCPVEKLGLKRCKLTQSVFKGLGSVLKCKSQLKSLIVGINEVGDRGVKHLWDAAVHTNCVLEELDVEMTDLTDACVEDVCAAIKASKTLKNLEMRNNLLTDVSVPALVQVMQNSDNMQEMNLKYNDFSEDVFDMLEDCRKIRY